MAGTGYFDKANQVYRALSIQTWDDFQGSSAGDDWDSINTWAGTSGESLSYTTSIYDFGSVETINPLLTVQTPGRFSTTIYYGDTVDSSGGAIDSPSSVTYTYGGDTVSSITARYFQFKIDFTSDSADDNILQFKSISATLDTKQQVKYVNNLNLNTLSGSVGQRTYVPTLNAQGCQVTVRAPGSDPYVADTYVEDGDSAGDPYIVAPTLERPLVYTTVNTSSIVFDVYESSGDAATRRDCTIDLVVIGKPGLVTDDTGNIVEA